MLCLRNSTDVYDGGSDRPGGVRSRPGSAADRVGSDASVDSHVSTVERSEDALVRTVSFRTASAVEILSAEISSLSVETGLSTSDDAADECCCRCSWSDSLCASLATGGSLDLDGVRVLLSLTSVDTPY